MSYCSYYAIPEPLMVSYSGTETLLIAAYFLTFVALQNRVITSHIIYLTFIILSQHWLPYFGSYYFISVAIALL